MRPDNWRELGFGTAETRIEKRSAWVGDCLEFGGSLRNGIAQLRISAGGHCWTECVQRVAYMLWVSEDIPDGHEVKRTCLNKKCIAPDHLAAVPSGSPASDAEYERTVAAGREASKRRRALDPRQVATIHRRVRDGKPLADLADKFGVSLPTIYSIANGFSYRDGRPMPERGKPSAYRRDAVHCNRKAGT